MSFTANNCNLEYLSNSTAQFFVNPAKKTSAKCLILFLCNTSFLLYKGCVSTFVNRCSINGLGKNIVFCFNSHFCFVYEKCNFVQEKNRCSVTRIDLDNNRKILGQIYTGKTHLCFNSVFVQSFACTLIQYWPS